jgi:hypothetical protein
MFSRGRMMIVSDQNLAGLCHASKLVGMIAVRAAAARNSSSAIWQHRAAC